MVTKPRRGTHCTLLLHDENGEQTVIPYAVYEFLNHHNMKDSQGEWMELWMLRKQFPVVSELSVFSALPGNVQVWPSMSHAVAHVAKYRVDKNGK